MKIGDIVYFFAVCLIYWWFSDSIFPRGLFPDIVFLAVFSASIISNPIKAMVISFFWGIFMDIYSSVHFGMYSLFYVTISYLAYNLKYKMDMNTPFSRIFSCLALNYVLVLSFFAFHFAYFRNFNIPLWNFIFQPLITVIFLEPFFYITYKAKRKNGFWL